MESETGLCWVKMSSFVRKKRTFSPLFLSVSFGSPCYLTQFCQYKCYNKAYLEGYSVILRLSFWELSCNVRTPQDEEFGLQLCLVRFIWKAMKLPGPGTHFHHNEPKLNQDWMLFSSEIEGGLCAMLGWRIWSQCLGLYFKQHFSQRVDDENSSSSVCISPVWEL